MQTLAGDVAVRNDGPIGSRSWGTEEPTHQLRYNCVAAFMLPLVLPLLALSALRLTLPAITLAGCTAHRGVVLAMITTAPATPIAATSSKPYVFMRVLPLKTLKLHLRYIDCVQPLYHRQGVNEALPLFLLVLPQRSGASTQVGAQRVVKRRCHGVCAAQM